MLFFFFFGSVGIAMLSTAAELAPQQSPQKSEGAEAVQKQGGTADTTGKSGTADTLSESNADDTLSMSGTVDTLSESSFAGNSVPAGVAGAAAQLEQSSVDFDALGG